MKLHELLPKNAILLGFNPADKADALSQMGTYMASLYDLGAPDPIVERLLQRESEMSTGIGFGIAIPHARVDGIDRLYMVAARTVDALEFDAIDGQPVHLIFMLLTPTNTASDHSRILATLSKIMSYEEVRTSLQTSESAERFLDVLINGEDKYVP